MTATPTNPAPPTTATDTTTGTPNSTNPAPPTTATDTTTGTPNSTNPTARSARAAVPARYDELAELLSGMDARGRSDTDLSAAAAAALAHEARMLDSGRFEDWLSGWTDDAVLWVPLSAPAHPGTDQSLLLDDRRRLAERVGWLRDPSAWGQQPPSRTTRVVGGVEAWAAPGGRVVTRSTLLVDEHRHGRRQQLAGCQLHELVGSDLRRRTKIIVMPALAAGVRNPSFLM